MTRMADSLEPRQLVVESRLFMLSHPTCAVLTFVGTCNRGLPANKNLVNQTKGNQRIMEVQRDLWTMAVATNSSQNMLHAFQAEWEDLCARHTTFAHIANTSNLIATQSMYEGYVCMRGCCSSATTSMLCASLWLLMKVHSFTWECLRTSLLWASTYEGPQCTRMQAMSESAAHLHELDARTNVRPCWLQYA